MLCKGFDEMTDEELRLAAVALVNHYRQTRDELYRRLADEATEVQARRMAAAPNPYGEACREGAEGEGGREG